MIVWGMRWGGLSFPLFRSKNNRIFSAHLLPAADLNRFKWICFAPVWHRLKLVRMVLIMPKNMLNLWKRPFCPLCIETFLHLTCSHVCLCCVCGKKTVALVTKLTFLTVIHYYGNSTSIFSSSAPQNAWVAWPHCSYKNIHITWINDTWHCTNFKVILCCGGK